MTEETALLRAIHCDMTATCGLLAALLYEKAGNDSPYEDVVSNALNDAGRYYNLANKMATKEER